MLWKEGQEWTMNCGFHNKKSNFGYPILETRFLGFKTEKGAVLNKIFLGIAYPFLYISAWVTKSKQ